MFHVPRSVLLFAFATFLLAGFVKGFIGMGLPAITTGLLTMTMAPGQARSRARNGAACVATQCGRGDKHLLGQTVRNSPNYGCWGSLREGHAAAISCQIRPGM